MKCVTSAHISLASASHIAQLTVRGLRSTIFSPHGRIWEAVLKKPSNIHHTHQGCLKGFSKQSFGTSLNEVFDHILSIQLVCESLRSRKTSNHCPFLILIKQGACIYIMLPHRHSSPYIFGCKLMFIFFLHVSTTNHVVLHFAFHSVSCSNEKRDLMSTKKSLHSNTLQEHWIKNKYVYLLQNCLLFIC